jgi:hypothetical protein
MEDAMKLQRRYVPALGGSILAVALAMSGVALANGGEFFLPAPEHGHVDLVYFGHIKDTDGNYLDGAEMTVHVEGVGMTFPFDNDTPGHYRSPDIGAQIKDAGETVDPSKITISCAKKGYKQVKPAASAVPLKDSGTYEIDFVLAKDQTDPKVQVGAKD